MRAVFAGFAVVAAIAFASVVAVSEVAAQSTCRQKCIDQEQACLKRTNNKGQCGDQARACVAKCK